MANGISIFGERGISGTFGFENNELHRRIFVNDPANSLPPLLKDLFGDSPATSPRSFPEPFDTFYAWSMSFETMDKGSQGDTEVDIETGIAMLADFPATRGGVTIDITYRPLDFTGSGNFVADEGWDFSAQTMSLIGNNFNSKDPTSLRWNDGGGPGGAGTPITNITAIVKIIPKIEFVQTQVYQPDLPVDSQSKLIGSINASALFAGASGGGGQKSWPEGTVLLSGLPVVRRWRFDGQQVFQWGVKLAINNYQDFTESSGTGKDYVTWNRLYRPENSRWEKIIVGTKNANLYPEDDLSQVIG